MNNNSKNVIRLSKQGYDEYIAKIQDLRNQLDSNAKYKTEAFNSAVGDGWHDNFEYEEASRKEKMILAEIKNMVSNLDNIVIVNEKENSDEIDLGDYVCFYQLDDSETMDGKEMDIMKLVAGYNIDIFAEIPELSIDSPAGNALYNCKIGDSSSFEVNGKKFVVIPKFNTKDLEQAIEFKKHSDDVRKLNS